MGRLLQRERRRERNRERSSRGRGNAGRVHKYERRIGNQTERGDSKPFVENGATSTMKGIKEVEKDSVVQEQCKRWRPHHLKIRPFSLKKNKLDKLEILKMPNAQVLV